MYPLIIVTCFFEMVSWSDSGDSDWFPERSEFSRDRLFTITLRKLRFQNITGKKSYEKIFFFNVRWIVLVIFTDRGTHLFICHLN